MLKIRHVLKTTHFRNLTQCSLTFQNSVTAKLYGHKMHQDSHIVLIVAEMHTTMYVSYSFMPVYDSFQLIQC